MIALYKGTSFISRIIRWRTWSDYSHAVWVCRDGTVIEAWVGGVRRVPGLLSQHREKTVVELYAIAGLNEEQRDRIETFLVAQLGKPYDYAAILGFALRKDTQNPAKWFCSELIFAACLFAGIYLLARIPPWKVSPDLLALSPLLIFGGKCLPLYLPTPCPELPSLAHDCPTG